MVTEPLKISCYREPVIQGGKVEAVCLDSEGREASLAARICKRFSNLHRCDYYKVVGEGRSKCLFLIEKTDLAKSVKRARAKFNSAMKVFPTKIGRPASQEFGNVQDLHEIADEFIYRELCEEHAAKAHSTLLVLEKIRLSKADEDLVGVFCYKKINYILVITGEYDNLLLGRVIENIRNRFDSTIIGANCFSFEREGGFEALILGKIQ